MRVVLLGHLQRGGSPVPADRLLATRLRPALRTCTVITTAAGPDMGDIHDRMPVVLDPVVLDEWLDPANRDKPELESLLVPSPEGTLVHRAVGRAVGNVRNDGPELIEAAGEDYSAAPVSAGRRPNLPLQHVVPGPDAVHPGPAVLPVADAACREPGEATGTDQLLQPVQLRRQHDLGGANQVSKASRARRPISPASASRSARARGRSPTRRSGQVREQASQSGPGGGTQSSAMTTGTRPAASVS